MSNKKINRGELQPLKRLVHPNKCKSDTEALFKLYGKASPKNREAIKGLVKAFKLEFDEPIDTDTGEVLDSDGVLNKLQEFDILLNSKNKNKNEKQKKSRTKTGKKGI